MRSNIARCLYVTDALRAHQSAIYKIDGAELHAVITRSSDCLESLFTSLLSQTLLPATQDTREVSRSIHVMQDPDTFPLVVDIFLCKYCCASRENIFSLLFLSNRADNKAYPCKVEAN